MEITSDYRDLQHSRLAFPGNLFFVAKTQPALQPSLQISSNRGSGENSAELLPTILYGWQADEAVIILACLIKAWDVMT